MNPDREIWDGSTPSYRGIMGIPPGRKPGKGNLGEPTWVGSPETPYKNPSGPFKIPNRDLLTFGGILGASLWRAL